MSLESEKQDGSSSNPPKPSQVTACPHCGKLLSQVAMLEHSCIGVGGQSSEAVSSKWSVARDFLAGGVKDQSRIASCPKCLKDLDVSGFDPLELIECSYCKMTFELLKEFGKFTLLKPYDTGWQSAVYLAEKSGAQEQSIIKVASSRVLAQGDYLDHFFRESENLYLSLAECQTSCFAGQANGFVYVAIGLKTNTSDEVIAKALGLDEEGSPIFKLDPAPHDQVQDRIVNCPKCQAPISALRFDPLDELFCPGCGKLFQLLRQFGQYRIDYRLGSGGTSILYLTQDQVNKRKVALKVLSAVEMQDNPAASQSLLREVELTRDLVHPNLIQVYEGGQFNGFYYMALELVEGLTLADILASIQNASASPEQDKMAVTNTNQERFKQALPELICLEIILQSVAGLGVAHSHGLIHGDVKPENIMLTYQGVVKVLDFGLVQFANAEKLLSIDGEHSITGTPLYIPPERVRGEPEDFTSDYYSLGATLYHLLRGIEPFRAKNVADLVMMHASSPLVSFKAYAPWVSDTTCRIVEKSMKKSLEGRYKSHVEFIADITLAKSLLMQSMNQTLTDGRMTLKAFMKSLPGRKKGFNFWKRAETSVISTYKYATRAITSRFQTNSNSNSS
jgi:serine/threonine protein kinase